ncbi:hypothetical protein A2716_03560 [candidate division WWE3 bacterium RIFCSPHIGHO2_01_FULL_40_23]|nr:MAG: hypothetical protein A2716_03560 [candidate division WWE3 bacterium RIFCSPHIGHO2_01_FULL_40_23]
MDILIALSALTLFFPFGLLFSLLIALEDKGSPIYHQPRVGKGRKMFNLFKFRSMIKNADEILFSDLKFLEKLRSGNHKLKDDPRITRIGSFIRKYSIDEFPQFINVLKGEMSFVGPRPFRPDEVERFERENKEAKVLIDKVLSVKPGITGLWQTGGRSEVTFDQRIRIEVDYVKRCSFFLDMYIILKTPFAVLKARGAL